VASSKHLFHSDLFSQRYLTAWSGKLIPDAQKRKEYLKYQTVMAKEELGEVTRILNLAFRGTWLFSFISPPLYPQEKGSRYSLTAGLYRQPIWNTWWREIQLYDFSITTNKMQQFLVYLFLKGSTCCGCFLHPSSVTHNCKHSFRYCQPILLQAGIVDEMEPVCSSICWQYLKLYLQLCVPDEGWRNHPKHVQPFRNK